MDEARAGFDVDDGEGSAGIEDADAGKIEVNEVVLDGLDTGCQVRGGYVVCWSIALYLASLKLDLLLNHGQDIHNVSEKKRPRAF